jgi:D-cysteine desulfhydrase
LGERTIAGDWHEHPGGSDMMAAMKEVAAEAVREGPKPYIIPGGGSNEIDATGYVACAKESSAQMLDMGLNTDTVVCASGSGGTHAGLVTGFHGNNTGMRVVGIDVSRPRTIQEELIYDLAQRTAKHVGVTGGVPRDVVQCFDEYVGAGYSLPTPGMVGAVNLLAQTEGILLDPVYTGKAMAGLVDLCRSGYFASSDKLMFVHTGGSPALYAYMPVVLQEQANSTTA